MFGSVGALRYLSLLGLVSQALCTSSARNARRQANPSLDVPADAKTLPLDCQDSIFIAGVSAEFKASKASTDEYFVQFKLSADAKDVADVLAQPLFKGVKVIQPYTKEYDRGFSAKLSYEQVCALDKDAKVSGAWSTSDGDMPTVPF
jgi:hypothetical protein